MNCGKGKKNYDFLHSNTLNLAISNYDWIRKKKPAAMRSIYGKLYQGVAVMNLTIYSIKNERLLTPFNYFYSI